LRLKPEWPEPVKRLAWICATSNDASLQDPLAAVQYAEKASLLADRQDPVMMDTLGVAYASAGRFGEARKMTQKAIELAMSSGNESLASMIQNRLSLYRAGRPFRENPTVK